MKKVATARKGAKRWAYEEVEVREDVKTNLPDDWKLRVFKVRSGDSGETYFVQVLDGNSNRYSTSQIVLCDCMQGKFLAPLSVLGTGEDFNCKHASQLLDFLKKTDD